MSKVRSGELFPEQGVGILGRAVRFLGRHWLFAVNAVVGTYALLPWISPLAKAWGWPSLGELVFRLYNPPICHQQKELSYHVLGHQVAFCQRDVAIYTTMLLAGLLFALFRRRLRPLRGWVFVLLVVPMVLDGVTQAPRAFLPAWPLRTENRWAVVLTAGVLPTWFYASDAVGSLNWWLRTVTGALFGLAWVWLLYPLVEAGVRRAMGREDPGEPWRATPRMPTEAGGAVSRRGLGSGGHRAGAAGAGGEDGH